MSVNRRRAALESYFMDALEDLRPPGDIALDIETYYPRCARNKAGLRIPAARDKILDRFQSKIRLLQLYRQNGDQVWLLDLKAWEEEGMLDHIHLQPLRNLLGSGERRIVGHCITTFDAPWLWHHHRFRFARIADTLTAHHLIMGGPNPNAYPQARGSLDLVLKHYLQFDYPSDQGASDWGVDQLSPQQIEYAEHDVSHSHELLAEQERVMRNENLTRAWELEQRLAPVCVDMCNRGAPFDAAGALAALQTVRPRLDEAARRACEWFGNPRLNLNSHPQLEAAFMAKGFDLPNHQAETLAWEAERLIKRGEEEKVRGLALLADYFHIRDKEDKFLIALIEATRSDGRIHAIFNPVGAKSGRFSCAGPNLQQVPRIDSKRAESFPVRSLSRAGSGYKLVVGDFSTMEILICGVLCEPRFLQALEDKHCVHCETGTVIFKRPVTPDDDEARKIAKFWNFGSLYGSKVEGLWRRARFRDGIDISYQEAALFYTRFMAYYRGLARHQARAREQANLSHVIEARTLVIERRMWLGRSWWERYTGLLNQPIQGSGAEMQKISMVEVDAQLKGKAEILNCIHDELLLRCREEDAEEVRAKLKEIMEEASEFILSGRARIPAEVRIVDAWSDKGSKVFLPPPLPQTITYQPVRASSRRAPDPSGISARAVLAMYADAQARGVPLEARPSQLDWPREIARLGPLTNLEEKFRWERMRWKMWEARQAGIPLDSLDGEVDPLLRRFVFCHPNRILDAVSQLTVGFAREAKDLQEAMEQILLLKVFNDPEPYRILCQIVGRRPTAADLDPERHWRRLTEARDRGELTRLWRPAYLAGGKGHKALFCSVGQIIKDRIADKIAACANLYEVTDLLQAYPCVADFHASQWAIDLSYTTFLRGKLEDFIWVGPGACKGISLWFQPRAWSWAAVNDTLRLLTAHQEYCYPLVNGGEPAPRLQGRLAFKQDVQNHACETQKYLLRPDSLRVYRGSGGKQPPPLLPRWW
jgi:DNA polymerase I-like protein with 3'-5' exonuclease and polymerase domains